MNKHDKIVIVGFGVFTISFFSFFSFMHQRAYNINLSFEFNGVIENIIYDVKGIPEITVNGKSYYISGNYYFDNKLEKGDSIKKEKGSNVYTLKKKKTGDIIKF